jgi:hypothetical protein
MFPPTPLPLSDADKSVVIVLCDDEIAINVFGESEERQWPNFVAEQWQRCADSVGRHHFLPVQVSKSAWPIHEKLNKTNFLRAWTQEPQCRDAWVARMITVELCRFISPDSMCDASALYSGAIDVSAVRLGFQRHNGSPVVVFLSHAVQDMNCEPRAFEAMCRYFDATQPIRTWIDSAEIEPGMPFDEAIQNAKYAILLVILTNNFSSRSWCRQEVLIAKKNNRPIVVVDALTRTSSRSFPYLGNVPVIAWNSDTGPTAVVDLLLKETLRHLYVLQDLARHKANDETVFPSPPEAATLLPLLHASTSILYPNPPLGDEESDLLRPLSIKAETPLQRAAASLNLRDWTVAISISESSDPERFGVFKEHLDSILLEISTYLLYCGASLAFGGHLGSDSYTVKLFDLTRSYQFMSERLPKNRIINFIGWPMTISKELQAKFQLQAQFRFCSRPSDVHVHSQVGDPFASAESRYAWARGLTSMRTLQTSEVRARVVVGGKFQPTVTASVDGGSKQSWHNGCMPGVLEEAFLSLRAKQPLFICGGFGGVAALLVQLLCNQETPDVLSWNFQKDAPHSSGMQDLYKDNGVPFVDYEEIVAEFNRGWGALNNGLNEAENMSLFYEQDEAEIVRLLLLGFGRLLSRQSDAGPTTPFLRPGE